jgi:hypothetical protein
MTFFMKLQQNDLKIKAKLLQGTKVVGKSNTDVSATGIHE